MLTEPKWKAFLHRLSLADKKNKAANREKREKRRMATEVAREIVRDVVEDKVTDEAIAAEVKKDADKVEKEDK